MTREEFRTRSSSSTQMNFIFFKFLFFLTAYSHVQNGCPLRHHIRLLIRCDRFRQYFYIHFHVQPFSEVLRNASYDAVEPSANQDITFRTAIIAVSDLPQLTCTYSCLLQLLQGGQSLIAYSRVRRCNHYCSPFYYLVFFPVAKHVLAWKVTRRKAIVEPTLVSY